jgi:hypothetical protein
LRTARGAGRLVAVFRFEVGRFLAVLRDRELVLALLPLLRLEDVLLLRDRVGEDVRVAMLLTLLIRHICPMDHGSVSPSQTPLLAHRDPIVIGRGPPTENRSNLGVDRSVAHS